MKIVIEIDENVFTRLFDNGIEDYAIVNDDLFSIAKSIRNGIPLDKIRAEIMRLDYDIEDVDYDYNDMTQTEVLHTIYREEVLQIIDKCMAESEE